MDQRCDEHRGPDYARNSPFAVFANLAARTRRFILEATNDTSIRQCLRFRGRQSNVQWVMVSSLMRPLPVAAPSEMVRGTVDVFDNLNSECRPAGDNPNMDLELERLSNRSAGCQRHSSGLKSKSIVAAETITEYMKERLPDALAQIRDTDFTKAVSDLKTVENTLQATLATSSRLMSGSSLLDYI